jgi:hypothetical protein
LALFASIPTTKIDLNLMCAFETSASLGMCL